MTTDEALIEIASSTAEAVKQVLEMVSSAEMEPPQVAVIPAGSEPLRSIPVPAVVANVSYIDGVTGGNIFVMTKLGVQRLAAAMMGQDPSEVVETEELSELDLSAAGEAMNQMMAAAAGATGSVLGEEVEIGPPETRLYATPGEATDNFEASPYMTNASFSLLGEPCRLVQLVPNAFVVRMTRALNDLEAEQAGGHVGRGDSGGVSSEALWDVPVRVWAELGRTRMAIGRAVTLPTGAVVDLDQEPDDPVDLYVNGRLFGSGRLLLVDDEWAVRIESVLPVGTPAEMQLQGGSN
jgi:flagellar motor switch protein FliN/FliY